MFEVTITGASLTELADKTAALAARLGGEVAAPTGKPKAAPKKAEPEAEKDKPEKPKAAPKKAEPKTEEPKTEEPKADIDFHKDVTPAVLKLTQEKGREATISVLDQFGLARASDAADEQLPELYAALCDAIEA